MIENNPSHALLCFKSWIEQGEKMLEGITEGPWAKFNHPGDHSTGFSITQNRQSMTWPVSGGGKWTKAIKNEHDADLIVASVSLIPGMLDGMKMMLEKYKLTVKEFGLDSIATRVLRRVILDVARTYEPRMVEAGFTVPEPDPKGDV